MATYTLTIDGVSRVIQSGWSFSRPKNGVGTMQATVYSATGSYIPPLDDEVVLARNGTTLFAGYIAEAVTRGIGGPTTPIETDITVHDFNAYTTRRYTSATFASDSLEADLTAVAAALSSYGVTVDAGQVTGPTLPAVSYSYWTVKDIFDDLARLSGFVWRINESKVLAFTEPGTVSAPFDVTLATGAAVGDVQSKPTRWQYANRVVVIGAGVIGVAQDSAEITANGIWEAVVQAPDATSQAQVDALAAGELAARLPTAHEVRYRTRTHGLYPGMSQTITIAARTINNTFTVQDVEAAHYGSDLVEYRVVALEGDASHRGWREGVAAWGGAGGTTHLPGTGGGGTGFSRPTYDLAFGVEFVESATPTWVDACEHRHVEIDTAVRGTTSADIVVSLRSLSAGVTVQARLYDVSNATPCAGTSSVINSTSWTRTTFAVTLTAGSYIYKLQLLPGTANEPVGADGYLE